MQDLPEFFPVHPTAGHILHIMIDVLTPIHRDVFYSNALFNQYPCFVVGEKSIYEVSFLT